MKAEIWKRAGGGGGLCVFKIKNQIDQEDTSVKPHLVDL